MLQATVIVIERINHCNLLSVVWNAIQTIVAFLECNTRLNYSFIRIKFVCMHLNM